jgi:hypothetical protein
MSLRYGYRQSKPRANYHQANSECVTTVIKEIGRMSINNDNQKPGYGGVGDAQKNKVCKEEMVEDEKNCGAYKGGYHAGGDGALQKLDYKHEAAFQDKQKHGYKQEAFEECADGYNYYNGYHGDGGAVKEKYDYNQKEEAFDGACGDGGYSLHYSGGGGAGKNKHYGYQHGAYGEAGAYHGGDKQQYGYGYQKDAYGAKADASGGYGYGGGYYGAGGAKQLPSNTYKQQAACGGAMTGVVQKHTYEDSYGEADAAGYSGAYYGGGGAMHTYDRYKQKAGYGYVGGGAMQTHDGYKQKAGYGYVGGGAMQTHDGYKQKAGYGYGGGAMQKQKHGYNKPEMVYGATAGGGYNYNGVGAYQYNNYSHGDAAYESESESEESDCEDAAFGHKHGVGGVHSYEAYERHETTSHDGYAGGGAGYGACAPPRNNRFFF